MFHYVSNHGDDDECIEQSYPRRSCCLALTAGAASAAVVCNEEGDCWRVSGEPRYEPGLKPVFLKDDWKRQEHEKDKYRWRESGRGHGHWHKGVWLRSSRSELLSLCRTAPGMQGAGPGFRHAHLPHRTAANTNQAR